MDFYHVLNRGTDKRAIVSDNKDRARFVHDLWAFNDANASSNFLHHARKEELAEREPLVLIHAFCLMKNHYHLLLSEVIENGIPLYMQKLNMGYTKYFNERYERSGTLWQGKYKKVLIERDAHFMYIPYYIHLNPLDYVFPEWREGRVKNPRKALEALRDYRWSSHLDYLGIKNFPSLTYRKEILKVDQKKYEQEMAQIIGDRGIAKSSEVLE